MVDLSNQDETRARFWELTQKAEKMRAKSGPLRDQHDDLIRSQAKARKTLEDKISTAEKGLFDIEQERAALARALGGQTGARPDA
jgi:predicted  nucleic acid-binding Zn-ribbon protein